MSIRVVQGKLAWPSSTLAAGIIHGNKSLQAMGGRRRAFILIFLGNANAYLEQYCRLIVEVLAPERSL
eukprot:s177_g15.t1